MEAIGAGGKVGSGLRDYCQDYQSARATTRTRNSASGKRLPYDDKRYKPQLTSSSVGLAQARPNYVCVTLRNAIRNLTLLVNV